MHFLLLIGVELFVNSILIVFFIIDGLSDSIITLFAIVIASEMLWVTIIAVLFSFFIILYTSSETINLVCASSDENGSSRNIISGFIASVLIKATL